MYTSNIQIIVERFIYNDAVASYSFLTYFYGNWATTFLTTNINVRTLVSS